MKKFKNISFKLGKFILIALFWIAVWELVSLFLNVPLLFPKPLVVINRLFELLFTKSFILSCLASIGRVTLGIVIATCLGAIIAVLCSLSKSAYSILYPILTIIKATPIASFVLILWIFLGDQKTPVIITVMMMLPIVWANMYQGIKDVNKDLLEVCKCYKLSYFKTVKAAYIPSIIPYFVSSLISGIGLSWKAGIAAEVLCSPNLSIGEAIFNAKYDFNGIDLFAWTVSVIILSLIFEIVVTRLIKLLFRKYMNSTGGNDGN